MPGSTSLGFRYPEENDPADVAGDIRNLAEDITDALLGQFPELWAEYSRGEYEPVPGAPIYVGDTQPDVDGVILWFLPISSEEAE